MGSSIVKKVTISMLVLFGIVPLPQPTNAQQIYFLSGSAKLWRLANYVPSTLALFYTGSVCAPGKLVLPANASEGDRDRLYSTISLSKTTNRPVFVYYSVNGGNCEISSFGMLEQP